MSTAARRDGKVHRAARESRLAQEKGKDNQNHKKCTRQSSDTFQVLDGLAVIRVEGRLLTLAYSTFNYLFSSRPGDAGGGSLA